MNIKDIQDIPKVQLHHHLDCSLRLETVWDLAHKNNISIKSKNVEDFFHEYKIHTQHKSLDEVLDRFLLCSRVLHTYEDIKRISFENVEDAFEQNIKLLELRFSPSFIALKKNIDLQEIIHAVLDGVKEAMDKYEIQVGLICTLTRELDFKVNIESVDCFLKAKREHPMGDRLIGIDLAGQEKAMPPKKFKDLLNKANEGGLRSTIHSGEDSSAEHMLDTIETLNPKRIGHGIKAIDEPRVIELVKQKDILLEVCPISNWITAAVLNYSAHPIRKLYNQGVKISLNTDDPQIFNIDLNQEHLNAHEKWGFSESELKQMNYWAFEKSFLPQVYKNKMKPFFEL